MNDSLRVGAPRFRQAARALLLLATGWLCVAPLGAAETRRLSRAELLDKIRGGWAGQMIGVAYGAPTEFKSNGKIGEWELEWKPGMLENTLHQDDLYVEMTFAKVMDDFGLEAVTPQYGEAFKDSKYHLWHANAGARRALNQGIAAPWSGHPKYNFHANDIDFQIEADFIGLMCPGLPRESNQYCDRVGRVMNYGDGLYGGMFVCGMYSVAYFETDPRQVVEAGLACIPAKSEYGRLIRDLLDWSAQHPDDWRQVWQLVQDKWDKDDPCPDGFNAPFNIDAKLNGAYIAFGLLFGGGDFEKTMEISTRCGQDSDCNPSSAAGVLGVMLGYNRIPARFTAEMATLEDKKFDFTDYSFNDIVKSTEARALKIVAMTGGRISDTEVVIKTQKPKAPKLEQWSPGIPDRRIGMVDAAWKWSGEWKSAEGLKVSEAAGSEAVLQFDGVAVAVIGTLDQSGGRAEVYLDGRKHMVGLDAYIVPNTHDNVLWQAYGLKPGSHTLRIVTTGQADARSKGRKVAIRDACVYRAAK
ncbi:MAG: ADP-ribosylglycohydrolase family protein [Limisphaerales bacterium]